MKPKWIPMLLVLGLLVAAPFPFQSVEATNSVTAVSKAKLPANLANLMDIAPEHQFTLRQGSKRIEVQLLQWTLNDYGLQTAVDGVFGPKTHKNVRQYQADKGLKVYGIVGKATWTALYGEY